MKRFLSGFLLLWTIGVPISAWAEVSGWSWTKHTISSIDRPPQWHRGIEFSSEKECEALLPFLVRHTFDMINRGEVPNHVPGETTLMSNGRSMISTIEDPISGRIATLEVEYYCFAESIDPRKSNTRQPNGLETMNMEDRINQVSIIMEFDPLSDSRRAAIVWQSFKPHTNLSEIESKIATAVMVYTRLLTSHDETRSELFHRVTKIAEGLIESGKFYTPDWHLPAGGLEFKLWPWDFHSATGLRNPLTYKATLMQSAVSQTTVGILDMEFGFERVLAPSAPLILVKGLSMELDSKDNYRLGKALLEANIKFASPENALPATDLIVIDAVARKIPTFAEDNSSVQFLGKEDAIQMFQLSLETWNKNARMAANVGTVTISEGKVKISAHKPTFSEAYKLIYEYPPSLLLPNGGVTTVHPLYVESKDKPTTVILMVKQPGLNYLDMVAKSLEIDIEKEMSPEFTVTSKFRQEESVCVATFHIEVSSDSTNTLQRYMKDSK